MPKSSPKSSRPEDSRCSKLPSDLPLQSAPESSALQTLKLIKMKRLRRLSHLLDNAIKIPGTPYRIGFDPIIGLIPGGGDIVGLVMSAFIVLEAAQMGASKSTLSTMAFNVLMETLAGTVPGMGDVFDAAWKSNARNIELLEQHLNLPQPLPARNRWFALLLILGLGLALLGCAYLSFRLLRWLFQFLAQ